MINIILNLLTNRKALKVIGSILVLFFLWYASKIVYDKISFANSKVKKELEDYELLKYDYKIAIIANDSLIDNSIECLKARNEMTATMQSNIASLSGDNKVLKNKNTELEKTIDHFIEVGACVETIQVKNGFLKKKTYKKILVDCPE